MDFLVGRDLNVEPKLEFGRGEFLGLDCYDWCGPHEIECRGGGEELVTFMKKLRWSQLLRDFDCVVTSTWASCDAREELHTRGWGPGGKNRLIILWDRVIFSSTFNTLYLNKARLRAWDHHPVVGKN